MKDCNQKALDLLNSRVKEYENKLRKDHPIKSKVSAWFTDASNKEKKRFETEAKYTESEMAIEECKKKDLKQAAYFLNRELIFRRDVNFS